MKSHYEIRAEYHSEETAPEPNLKTPHDKHRFAMFQKGNRFLRNGRTYNQIDEHGEHISSFVSQYSAIVDRNIEPGVKDAVFALNQKGYLTFTSCQGHADSRYRYIGVVFKNTEQKKKFMLDIDALGCDIHWFDNAINTVERPSAKNPWYSDPIELHIVWDANYLKDSSIKDRRDIPYTESDLTRFWNIQMCRNYESYESIVLSFGYPLVERTLWDEIKKRVRYQHSKITTAYADFLNKVDALEEYKEQ